MSESLLSRRQLPVQTNEATAEVTLYYSQYKNEPSSHLIYELSELVPKTFMVSVTSFKSSSIQHDVDFVNYGPI